MKVITRCIISLKTLQVVSEESYKYEGEVALCKGGSGGGGGAGSGAIDYPDYMERIHEDWLDDTGTDTISDSVTSVMSSALGSSPWSGETAYDPDTDITAWETAISDFATILAGLSDTVDWAALYTQAETSIPDADIAGITETEITDDVDAFSDQIDDEITTKVLPRFQAGMRDINAVMSSAFVLGEAIIEGFRDRDVAKHNSALRLAAAEINSKIDSERVQVRLKASEIMKEMMTNRVSWEQAYAQMVAESRRIKIVAKKEETDMQLKIDEMDALWDLEVFQYGANLLAAIGGGTASTKADKPSMGASMIGGAMTGAAAGGMIAGASKGTIANPVGIIGGAILGAASALF
jgi:hypothetical protein